MWRRALWVAVVAAGCGKAAPVTEKPWDKNGDGLVGACEGLSQPACGAAPNCEYAQYVCDAIACSDPNSCVNTCPADECRPKLPPPPPACEQLSPGACHLFPQCVLSTQTVCWGNAGSAGGLDDKDSAGSAPVPPIDPNGVGCGGGGCTTSTVCVTRPTDCGSRSLATCANDGKCELESWACLAVCEDDGHGGCKPCPAPESRCVPVHRAPPPDPRPTCGGIATREACSAAGCEVREWECAQVCLVESDGGCAPCGFSCDAPAALDGGSAPPHP
ncbi:MAG: hypothetical protein K1X89_31065 [Myxococcaceae bacterium]|nr:hypothetical protein [Myxococcaceae bacterium]